MEANSMSAKWTIGPPQVHVSKASALSQTKSFHQTDKIYAPGATALSNERSNCYGRKFPFRVSSFEFRVSSFGFRVSRFAFRVSRSGFESAAVARPLGKAFALTWEPKADFGRLTLPK